MGRRLSNIEWATFLKEVPVDALNLPPWGAVVEWGGMSILVYIPPQDCGWLYSMIGQCPAGEIFLTDVTGDIPGSITNSPKEYDPWSQTWIYHYPEEFIDQAAEMAARSGQLITSGGKELLAAVKEAAEAAGAAAGAATGPLLENLTVPLIVAGVIAIVFLANK